MDKKEYYRRNKIHWKRGGKYYKYEPKVIEGGLIIRKGVFLISFD